MNQPLRWGFDSGGGLSRAGAVQLIVVVVGGRAQSQSENKYLRRVQKNLTLPSALKYLGYREREFKNGFAADSVPSSFVCMGG
jgi:hypothetical protein